jgi:hypothetical protein
VAAYLVYHFRRRPVVTGEPSDMAIFVEPVADNDPTSLANPAPPADNGRLADERRETAQELPGEEPAPTKKSAR